MGTDADRLHPVCLDGDVRLHQSMFLQKVLHSQQMRAMILRQKTHLEAKEKKLVQNIFCQAPLL